MTNNQNHNSDRVTHFITQYKQFAAKSAENVLELAKVMHEAKITLNKQEFSDFCQGIGMDRGASTHKKLKVIAKNFDMLKKHESKLPSNWTTLYKLASLSEDQFQSMVEGNMLKPNVTGVAINRALSIAPKIKKPAAGQHQVTFKGINSFNGEKFYKALNELAVRISVEVTFSAEAAEIISQGKAVPNGTEENTMPKAA